MAIRPTGGLDMVHPFRSADATELNECLHEAVTFSGVAILIQMF